MWGCSKGAVQITAKMLNHGVGHGIEAPRIYWLYSPEAYLRHLKVLVDAAGDDTAKVSIKEGPEETQSLPIWDWSHIIPYKNDKKHAINNLVSRFLQSSKIWWQTGIFAQGCDKLSQDPVLC